VPALPPGQTPPCRAGAGGGLRAPACSAPGPSRPRGIGGADPNIPQEQRDCKARGGPAPGQVQRNCWCLESQSPLGLAALSHHRDSQEIQLLQPSGPPAAAQQKLCFNPGGPEHPWGSSGGTEPSLTFAVWSREAVAARAKGPPKPQHKSVMGRLCRDHTWRGSGIWEGSACSTLHRRTEKRAGTAGQMLGMPEQGGCGESWPRLCCLRALLAGRTKQDTEATCGHSTRHTKDEGHYRAPHRRGDRDLSCHQQ